MRIRSIGVNYPLQTQFQGKHTCMKWCTAIFGGTAAIGAIGGSLIMTGGLSAIPLLATYIGIGAGSGALIGHSIDKKSNDLDIKA